MVDNRRELERLITVALMQQHVPILHAALRYYIAARKIPPQYEQATKVLYYVLASTLDRIENGDNTDDNW